MKPKKSLGQNYLHDENICRNIIKAFLPEPDDIVIEIGPGQGALTKYLVKEVSYTGIELDRYNFRMLKQNFPDNEFISSDFLKTDLNMFRRNNEKLRVIGNIPYNITSEILFRLIDNRNIISDALLMIQNEVAKRLTAKPRTKDYGITSVFTQIFSKCSMLMKVSKNCFYPKPEVESRVIKIIFTDEFEKRIKDISLFKSVVRTAFGTRRKTLKNSLRNLTETYPPDFNLSCRAEELSPEDFIELSNRLYELHQR